MDSRIPDGFSSHNVPESYKVNTNANADEIKKRTIAELKADEIGKGAAEKSLSEKLSDFRDTLPSKDASALNGLLGDGFEAPEGIGEHAESKHTDSNTPGADAAVYLKPMQIHIDDAVYLKPMQIHIDDAVYLKPMQIHIDELKD